MEHHGGNLSGTATFLIALDEFFGNECYREAFGRM